MARRGWLGPGAAVWALGLAVVALLATASCDNLSPEVASVASRDPGAGPILVGHYASMTGSEATFGQSTDHAIRLALAERNARGGVRGRPIELITLDDASKSAEAGTAATRLIIEHHVVALLGEVSSGLSIVGGRIAQSYRVPMISPSSTANAVTTAGDMVSRVCFIDDFQGYVMARFALDHLKATRVGILYDQQQAQSKSLATVFDRDFRALGGTITTRQAYTGGDASVSAQLQSLKDSNVQAIYLPGYYNDVAPIAIQARKLGLDVPLLGGDGWDSAKLAEIGGPAIEGSYYSNQYSFDEDRPAVQDFVRKYQAAYGQVPDGIAALGYDAALVLFDAMDRAPALDAESLAKAIAETRDFPAVTGKITLDKDRNPVKSAVVVVMRGGQPRYATRIEPLRQPLPKVAEAAIATGEAAAGSPGAKLLQTVVDTLALGALYALIALGYTLVYGVLRFINFAHADVFTFGAWISFVLAGALGLAGSPLGLPITMVLAMVACAALGVVIERFAYRPLRKAPRLNVLITAIGVSLLLQNTGLLPWAFGPNPQHMPALIHDASLIAIAGVHVRAVDTVVVALAIVLVGALEYLVYKSQFGRAMRAVSFNEQVASLMGIDVGRVITVTFAIGSALAAAGGLLYGLKYESLQITAHSTWVLLGLTAFVAAVIGGIGDVRGAAVGALLIAAVQQFGAAYVSTQLRDVYVFTILILVLLLKPAGLFGRAVVEKV
ncbi:MAG TPA: ABC transporter substrate-binding protein [Kofleriaceae bacterium]|nr:ABC transporter substrate-binding protein [Kofleriaceae bacterium]